MSKTLTALVDRVSNEQLLTKLVGIGTQILALRPWRLFAGPKAAHGPFETLVQREGLRSPKGAPADRREIGRIAEQRQRHVPARRATGQGTPLRPLDFVVLATRRDVEQLTLRVIQLSAEVHSLASGKAKPIVQAAE
jgi:hypothetical protein